MEGVAKVSEKWHLFLGSERIQLQLHEAEGGRRFLQVDYFYPSGVYSERKSVPMQSVICKHKSGKKKASVLQ